MPENNAVESLKNRLKELKTQISEYRKKGYDMKIADLKSMNISSKIQMASITEDEKDIRKIIALLNDVEKEIDIAKKESFKKEEDVLNLKGLRIEILIDKAEYLLKDNKIKRAKSVYSEIESLYNKLPNKLKKELFGKCASLHKKIVET